MTAPQITVVFNPPLASDTGVIFDAKAFDTLANWNPWSVQANTLANYCNTVSQQVTAAALTGQVTPSPANAGQHVRLNAAGSALEFVPQNVKRIYLTTGTGATYTPTAGARSAIIRGWGGGGAGGGVDGQGSGSAGAAPGGGAGGYFEVFIPDLADSYTYTIGAGGTPGAAGENPGGNGGNTTITDGAGFTATANGGEGGIGTNASLGNTTRQGALGGTASGGDLNVSGMASEATNVVGGERANIGEGAGSAFGAGGLGGINSNGAAGTGYASGGGGASTIDVTTNYAGGAGAGGLIIIDEMF